MRRWKCVTYLLAGILSAVCLSGCSSGAEPADTTAAQQMVVEAVGSPETAADVSSDHYEEIVDRSQDEGKLTIYFLDLETGPDAKDKSGDSTILIAPDGSVMLLDAGHPDAADQVISVLKDLGVEKIDYLVVSHPHIDHIGGIPAVMEQFPVEKVYSSYVEYTTKTYQNYLDAAEASGAELVKLKTGDVFAFGDQIQVEILGPDQEITYPDGFPENSTQFLNDHSLLMKFCFGETTALFGGDLYLAQEREYVEQYGGKLQADIAKANHHGKDTSNSKKWIKTVQPRITAVMGDEMGSMDIYHNYQKAGAEYHHTLYDGVIKVTADDKRNCQVLDQKDSWLN